MSRKAYRTEDLLGTEFNEFLFARVNVGPYGGHLSVVSALARLDLDAWAEAAKLARLPSDIAAGKLSELLAKVSEIPQTPKEAQKVAVRLVALLPGHQQDGAQKSEQPASSDHSVGVGFTMLMVLLVVALLVGGMTALVGVQIAGLAGPALAPLVTTASAPIARAVRP
jgi:hypothetical protein